jgi:hypothetical protein
MVYIEYMSRLLLLPRVIVYREYTAYLAAAAQAHSYALLVSCY